MRCERAEEFFSDYLEGTLERPMAVALEGHMGACAACAVAVATLRRTWSALDALPMVEPPADFARRVAARVAEDAWARGASRHAARGLLQGWLRSLTPVHGFSAAAIAALLVVGLSLPRLQQPENGTELNPLNLKPKTPTVTTPNFPAVPSDAASAPRVTAQATRWENGRWVGVVQVTPSRALPDSVVRATTLAPIGTERMGGTDTADLASGTMQSARTYALPIPLSDSPLGAHAVMVAVASPALAGEQRKVVAFPLAGRSTSGTISLDVDGEDIYVVLARLAAATRRPVVADAGLTGKVTRRLTAATPEQALNAVLLPLGYSWRASGDSYMVVSR